MKLWLPLFDPTFRPRVFFGWVLWRISMPNYPYGLKFYAIGKLKEVNWEIK